MDGTIITFNFAEAPSWSENFKMPIFLVEFLTNFFVMRSWEKVCFNTTCPYVAYKRVIRRYLRYFFIIVIGRRRRYGGKYGIICDRSREPLLCNLLNMHMKKEAKKKRPRNTQLSIRIRSEHIVLRLLFFRPFPPLRVTGNVISAHGRVPAMGNTRPTFGVFLPSAAWRTRFKAQRAYR